MKIAMETIDFLHRLGTRLTGGLNLCTFQLVSSSTAHNYNGINDNEEEFTTIISLHNKQ